MSETRETDEARRVLLAAESPGPAEEHLSAARVLAELLGAELAGLFIEDVNLVRLAALPFTQEVGRVSGAVRPLEVPDVERRLRREAEQARRSLEALAQELKLPWSFQVARGTLLDAFKLAVEADAAVVAPRRHRASRGAARKRKPDGLVLALFDASEAAFRALSAAAGLAQHASVTLSIVIPAASERAFESLREAAQQAVASPAPPLRYQRVPELSATALRPLACNTATRAVVLWSEGPGGPRAEIRALIEEIECPLVLVR